MKAWQRFANQVNEMQVCWPDDEAAREKMLEAAFAAFKDATREEHHQPLK